MQVLLLNGRHIFHMNSTEKGEKVSLSFFPPHPAFTMMKRRREVRSRVYFPFILLSGIGQNE